MHEKYSLFQILIFLAIVLGALGIDLWSHRKRDTAVTMKGATLWSIFWVFLSLGFAVFVGFSHGKESSYLFISGYLLEKSLSVDNLFVFMAIFSSFGIKDSDQHRVLYYGILGALILRLVFILIGVSLLEKFGTIAMAFFAMFILWSAWKMWSNSEAEEKPSIDYSQHFLVKTAARLIPVSSSLDGHRFFTHQSGRWMITPMLLCLLTVEFADLMFAFDSVPAVIAITKEPFLVYSSNIFAILGLRAMYFLLAAAKRSLVHLEKSVIAILVFIGVKMLLDIFSSVHINSTASLFVLIAFLAIGIGASLYARKRKPVLRDGN